MAMFTQGGQRPSPPHPWPLTNLSLYPDYLEARVWQRPQKNPEERCLGGEFPGLKVIFQEREIGEIDR